MSRRRSRSRRRPPTRTSRPDADVQPGRGGDAAGDEHQRGDGSVHLDADGVAGRAELRGDDHGHGQRRQPASLSDSETITITVDEVNVAPVLASIGNKSVDEQATLTIHGHGHGPGRSRPDADVQPGRRLRGGGDDHQRRDRRSSVGRRARPRVRERYNVTVTVTDNGTPALT